MPRENALLSFLFFQGTYGRIEYVELFQIRTMCRSTPLPSREPRNGALAHPRVRKSAAATELVARGPTSAESFEQEEETVRISIASLAERIPGCDDGVTICAVNRTFCCSLFESSPRAPLASADVDGGGGFHAAPGPSPDRPPTGSPRNEAALSS